MQGSTILIDEIFCRRSLVRVLVINYNLIIRYNSHFLSAAEVWDIRETSEARDIEFSKSFIWLTSKVSSYPQDPLAIIVPDQF